MGPQGVLAVGPKITSPFHRPAFLPARNIDLASATPAHPPLQKNHFASQLLQVRFGAQKLQEATVPVIDLKKLKAGDKREIERMGQALHEYGFFALKRHGVPNSLFQRHYAMTEKLFQMPRAALEKFDFLRRDAIERGWAGHELKPMSNEDGTLKKGADGQILTEEDRKQHWITEGDHNIYPKGQGRFARVNQKLYRDMEQVGLVLVDALAQWLDDEKGILRKMVRDENGAGNGLHMMRSIHYPPFDEKDLARLKAGNAPSRIGIHADISLLTLLPQSTGRGLQLLQKNGQWLDVDAQEGMIIVNSGDQLKLLSQNIPRKEIESRPHRVVADADTVSKPRYSSPFFFNLNLRGPVRDLHTGEYLRVTQPEKNITDLELDEGLRYLYARFFKAGTVGGKTSYEAFRERYHQVGTAIKEAAAKQPGIRALYYPELGGKAQILKA